MVCFLTTGIIYTLIINIRGIGIRDESRCFSVRNLQSLVYLFDALGVTVPCQAALRDNKVENCFDVFA
jgi:hypothetical protein